MAVSKSTRKQTAVFPANSKKNKSNTPKYPIPDKAHARNAIARAVQNPDPAWYKGNDLVADVRRAVKSKFPSIKQNTKKKKKKK